jgi:hypothetical protein
MNLLPLNTEIVASKDWFEVSGTGKSVKGDRPARCPRQFFAIMFSCLHIFWFSNFLLDYDLHPLA